MTQEEQVSDRRETAMRQAMERREPSEMEIVFPQPAASSVPAGRSAEPPRGRPYLRGHIDRRLLLFRTQPGFGRSSASSVSRRFLVLQFRSEAR